MAPTTGDPKLDLIMKKLAIGEKLTNEELLYYEEASSRPMLDAFGSMANTLCSSRSKKSK